MCVCVCVKFNQKESVGKQIKIKAKGKNERKKKNERIPDLVGVEKPDQDFEHVKRDGRALSTWQAERDKNKREKKKINKS